MTRTSRSVGTVILARFTGLCRNCRQSYQPGDLIRKAADRVWIHDTCPNGEPVPASSATPTENMAHELHLVRGIVRDELAGATLKVDEAEVHAMIDADVARIVEQTKAEISPGRGQATARSHSPLGPDYGDRRQGPCGLPRCIRLAAAAPYSAGRPGWVGQDPSCLPSRGNASTGPRSYLLLRGHERRPTPSAGCCRSGTAGNSIRPVGIRPLLRRGRRLPCSTRSMQPTATRYWSSTRPSPTGAWPCPTDPKIRSPTSIPTLCASPRPVPSDLIDDKLLDRPGRDRLGRTGLPTAPLGARAHVIAVLPCLVPRGAGRDHRTAARGTADQPLQQGVGSGEGRRWVRGCPSLRTA